MCIPMTKIKKGVDLKPSLSQWSPPSNLEMDA